MSQDAATLELIRGNIFSAAWPAVEPADLFPWHCDRFGKAQTWKRQSSQALAIDVFGTLKVSPQAYRDVILDQLAMSLGVAPGGPWTVELEWLDPENHLREPRRTQVDALARGARSLILFECKFTEPGGSCSQPKRISGGKHAGLRQCDGSYRWQTNPTNGVAANCALSGKRIRYWEVVPKILRFNSANEYSPCPFSGSWFQWMRNLALCHEIAASNELEAALVIAHADGFHVTESGPWTWRGFTDLLAPGAPVCVTRSYLTVIRHAVQALKIQGLPAETWCELQLWVAAKIAALEPGSVASSPEGLH